jgi:putative DNA primase/helicase
MSENFDEDYSDLEERYGSSGPKAPGEIIPLRPQKPGEEWKAGLRYNDKGLTKDPGNAALILANDPDWAGLRFDEFTGKEVCSAFPRLAGMPEPTTPEGVELYVTHWLAKARHQTFSTEAVRGAIHFAAHRRSFHQVRDYLETLAWDGKKRIGTWLTVYLGAQDTAASQAMGRMWLISAVARAYKPGSKVDHMLVLEGSQGARKTTALEALCSPAWFQPELGDLKHKDAQSALKGKWVVCMDELHSLRSSDVTELAKNYLTRTVDKYRPAYGKHDIEQPRSCVFAGTTNADTYLTDPTGNRRFWPVAVTDCKPDAIRADRDQLWAEAKEAYLSGEQWWPSKEQQREFSDVTEQRTQGDEWDKSVGAYVAGYDSVAVSEVLSHLGLEPKDWDMRHQQRVGKILTKLGWHRKQVRNGAKREWRYYQLAPVTEP